MNALSNYAGSLERQYGLKFLDARIEKVVGDTLLLNYFSTWDRSQCVCWVCLVGLLVKNEDVLPFLKRLNAKNQGGKDLGITYVDNNVLYISDPKHVVMTIVPADFLSTNRSSHLLSTRSHPFHL